MSGAARVGQDRTGNVIVGNLAPTVRVNNKPIAVTGAAVIPYGSDCKSNPRLGPGSATVKAQGISVVRAGDTDICGTPVSPGSQNVRVGG